LVYERGKNDLTRSKLLLHQFINMSECSIAHPYSDDVPSNHSCFIGSFVGILHDVRSVPGLGRNWGFPGRLGWPRECG
jgi:hypothetical protein